MPICMYIYKVLTEMTYVIEMAHVIEMTHVIEMAHTIEMAHAIEMAHVIERWHVYVSCQRTLSIRSASIQKSGSCMPAGTPHAHHESKP